MKHTILISGTAQTIRENTTENTTTIRCYYNVYIWGCLKGGSIQLITQFDGILNGYDDLWKRAKETAALYFSENEMKDGGYTIFHDHLITRMPIPELTA